MQHDLAVKNTVTAWLIVKGNWPTRVDMHCETNRDKAVAEFESLRKSNPGIRMERAHLVMIKDQWHRVNVNPVLCDVPPVGLKENAQALLRKLNLEGKFQ